LVKGDTVTPSSGKGSNMTSTTNSSPRSDVSFIIVGGGFDDEAFHAIKETVDAVKPMAYFRADRSKVPPGARGPPPPEVIGQRILESVSAEDKGQGAWEPGVYWY
jgi:hypothetical protein